MSLFDRRKVDTVYWFCWHSRPPTKAELEVMPPDKYDWLAYVVEKGHGKKFRSLWQKAKKQNAKIKDFGSMMITVSLVPEDLKSVTREQRLQNFLSYTTSKALDILESRLKKPCQTDRFFYGAFELKTKDDDSLPDDSDRLLMSAVFYFSD